MCETGELPPLVEGLFRQPDLAGSAELRPPPGSNVRAAAVYAILRRATARPAAPRITSASDDGSGTGAAKATSGTPPPMVPTSVAAPVARLIVNSCEEPAA